jgi:hypothetical protein
MRILWVITGGLAALIAMSALVIALLITHSSPGNKCDTGIDNKHCNFITVVRDTGRYSNKSDASLATYGDEMCNAMRNGATTLVEEMENPLIVSAAKHNLCTDVN